MSYFAGEAPPVWPDLNVNDPVVPVLFDEWFSDAMGGMIS